MLGAVDARRLVLSQGQLRGHQGGKKLVGSRAPKIYFKKMFEIMEQVC